jgi:hypothetical protein
MNILAKKSLFWDVGQVDIRKNERFIIERILQYGDEADFCWAQKFYGLNKIKEVAMKGRSLDRKSYNFWRQYFCSNKEYASRDS